MQYLLAYHGQMVGDKEQARAKRGVLWISACLAIAAHLLLSLISFDFFRSNTIALQANKLLYVQLQSPIIQKEIEPRPEQVTKLPVEANTNSLDEKKAPSEPLVSVPKSAIVQSKQADTVVFNTGLLHQWLEQETENSSKTNTQELTEFKQSFHVSRVEERAEDRLEDLSPLGTGIYKARINGRDICTLRMVSPHQDDWARDIVTTRDCTPDEKFEFKLR